MEVVSRHFSSIDSTNSWAKLHLHEFDRNKITIITADGQTAGRGQFERKWMSPTGKNIYASFCFFMDNGRSDVVNIPQILAITVVKALESFGFQVKIKWPNDLILLGKKVGGILCETTTIGEKLGVVLGLGLNVNMELDQLKKIDQPATSLAQEKGSDMDPKVVFEAISDLFGTNIEIFLKEGFAPFLETLNNHLMNAGKNEKI
jgi:BirA family biotin operon repressor/biotin-[acetyl-CoA-carboxylase] ligase